MLYVGEVLSIQSFYWNLIGLTTLQMHFRLKGLMKICFEKDIIVAKKVSPKMVIYRKRTAPSWDVFCQKQSPKFPKRKTGILICATLWAFKQLNTPIVRKASFLVCLFFVSVNISGMFLQVKGNTYFSIIFLQGIFSAQSLESFFPCAVDIWD